MKLQALPAESNLSLSPALLPTELQDRCLVKAGSNESLAASQCPEADYFRS